MRFEMGRAAIILLVIIAVFLGAVTFILAEQRQEHKHARAEIERSRLAAKADEALKMITDLESEKRSIEGTIAHLKESLIEPYYKNDEVKSGIKKEIQALEADLPPFDARIKRLKPIEHSLREKVLAVRD
jgi:CHASE3 domain sensor protein